MFNRPQIYLDGLRRRNLLEKHEFYVEQAKRKILCQFDDIENEARQKEEEVYEQLGKSAYGKLMEQYDAGEIAYEHACEHYELLRNMKMQMRLAALAGMYHQWEKDLRDFLEKEIQCDHKWKGAESYCWGSMKKLDEVLKAYGIDIQKMPFYDKINAARLIVNVYKHGKGASFEELCKEYPRFVKPSFLNAYYPENLTVSLDDFESFAEAIKTFWQDFPERSFRT